MIAIRSGTRTLFILGLSLALWGCARQPASAPAGAPGANEKKPVVSVVEVAPEGTPPDLKPAFEQARGYCVYYQSLLDRGLTPLRGDDIKRSEGVSKALTSVKTGLAELPITPLDKVPPWVKMRLNTAGAKFDAVRFTHAYGFPGDLWLALVFPVKTTVSLFLAQEGGRAQEDLKLKDFHAKRDLAIRELNLPPQNAAFFLQFEGGKLTTGCEFLLAITFPDETPKDVYIKLKTTNSRSDKCEHFTTAHPIAERLGLELPFQFSAVAALKERATDVAEHRGPEAGLQFLDDHLGQVNDRDAEFYRVHLRLVCAQQLLKDNKSRDQAIAQLLKAGEAIRKVREKYPPSNPVETRVLLMALYNEACGLALSGKPEAGLKSLQEAFHAGYRDVAGMRSDDDLESVRQLPAYEEWLKSLE